MGDKERLEKAIEHLSRIQENAQRLSEELKKRKEREKTPAPPSKS